MSLDCCPLNKQPREKQLSIEKLVTWETQDVLVYASVISNLDNTRSRSSCFISRNPKDFANPDIRNGDLANRGRTLLTNFTDGYDYV